MLTAALVLLTLILLNGVFALSEMSVVSSRKARLQQLADDGAAGASAALNLANEPSHFLSTIQIGITVIGILSGALGEATLADPLGAWLHSLGMPENYADEGALVVVVSVITLVSLVIGELVPKRLALLNPEAVASIIARPMGWLSRLVHPFVRLLSFLTESVLRILGARKASEPPVTEEEIKVLMEQGTDAGVFDKSEQAIVSRLFALDQQRVGAVMTPRVDIDFLDLRASLDDVRGTLRSHSHSRFPVLGLDGEAVGFVRAKDLVDRLIASEPLDLAKLVRKPLFVPDSLTLMQVLETFRRNRETIAMVVDEYGETQGLVTLNDVLGALVGDIGDPGEDTTPDVVRRADGSWLVDGTITIARFKEVTAATEDLPEESEGRYHTLSGLTMEMLRHMPQVGNRFETEEFRFEVVDMDRHRVDKLLVTRRSSTIAEV